MNEQEIRIGNLLIHEGKVKKVSEIGRKQVNEGNLYYLSFDDKNRGYWLKHNGVDLIEPIPLTEEWLLKFGFEKDFEGDVYKNVNSNSFLCWQNNRVELLDDENNKCMAYCDHVHQLQNLYFALTGEELTLTETK